MFVAFEDLAMYIFPSLVLSLLSGEEQTSNLPFRQVLGYLMTATKTPQSLFFCWSPPHSAKHDVHIHHYITPHLFLDFLHFTDVSHHLLDFGTTKQMWY